MQCAFAKYGYDTKIKNVSEAALAQSSPDEVAAFGKSHNEQPFIGVVFLVETLRLQCLDSGEIREFLELFDCLDFPLHKDLLTFFQWDIGKVCQSITVSTAQADDCYIETCSKSGMPDEFRNQ